MQGNERLSAHYIVTPLGDLTESRWVAIMELPEGHKIVTTALKLRHLAASCEQGGRLCHPNGIPLTIAEMAIYCRVEPVWLAPVLAGTLTAVGHMEATVDGGWRCTDPVLLRHVRRISNKRLLAAPATPALPPPPKKGKRYSRPLTSAERQQLKRTGKLPPGVTVLVTSCHVMSHLVTDACVTNAAQPADIIGCHSSHINTDSNLDTAADERDSSVTEFVAAPPHKNLTPGIEAEIGKLPPAAQAPASITAQNELEQGQEEDVVVASISKLAESLQAAASGKGKAISNPGGWLRTAIRLDYAAVGREAAAAQAEVRATVEARRQAEKTEQVQRQEEERRQAAAWVAQNQKLAAMFAAPPPET